ncbi:hypothetical protein [Streptomyces canus]|uniref:hypothetical protein n=1 Tax=Streptomyces canus TaxID=58343 RepID=UPI0027D8B330|nr:hypothetical protein [Streptomyces canus]
MLENIDKTVRDITERTLLLLDGIEHIAGGLAVPLARHLADTPLLTVLATGQEILRTSGECVLPVPPLPPPGELLEADVADVQDNPAVQLFVRCGRQANPAFALTPENVGAVVDICNLLEGRSAGPGARRAPTAAVSAAGTARLAAAGRRPSSAGALDVPERQRSTLAIAEWSCRGLSAPQRSLLARLALFQGGVTLPTAEKVSPLGAAETTVALETMLDRGLLTLEEQPRADSRLTMPRTVRAYGLALLEEAGPERALAARQAHARHYRRLLPALEGRFHGSEQQRWLRVAVAQHDNVLAALRHLEDEDGTGTGTYEGHEKGKEEGGGGRVRPERAAALLERAGLVTVCLQPWLVRGELKEGLRWFDATGQALKGAEWGERAEDEEWLRTRARLYCGAGAYSPRPSATTTGRRTATTGPSPCTSGCAIRRPPPCPPPAWDTHCSGAASGPRSGPCCPRPSPPSTPTATPPDPPRRLPRSPRCCSRPARRGRRVPCWNGSAASSGRTAPSAIWPAPSTSAPGCPCARGTTTAPGRRCGRASHCTSRSASAPNCPRRWRCSPC